MTMSTGVYLTKLLESYGVDVVFGIPGVHTVEIYRGLTGSGLHHVTPRHEQGAGFMADGYARASGKPGVAIIISGPGMTNILTAMGQAYGDSVPMLVISTVNAHGRMGSGEGWLHELPDQSATVAGVCAFSRTIHHPAELAPAMAQAFALFDGARPRPVHIEIPIDVMLSAADDLPVPVAPARLARPVPPQDAVDAAATLLSQSLRPVILAGGGAGGDIRALAEALDAPVVMTVNGRGHLPPGHPLAVNLSPSYTSTRALIAQADVVLALGTELGPTDYDMYEDGGFAIPGTLIRCDIDPAQVQRGAVPSLVLIGDASAAAAMLRAQIVPGDRDGARRAAQAAAGLDALPPATRGDLRMLDMVRDTLPDALIVGDSTQLVYSGNIAFAAARPGSYWNSATGFGTLGYGLPAAIGARIGAPGRPVVALVGDGGLQFSIAELTSATEAQTPLIVLLHDNKGYGEIKSYMMSQNIPPLGVDLFTPDFAMIAQACGWNVARLKRPQDVAPALRDAAAAADPTMLIFGDALRQEFVDAL